MFYIMFVNILLIIISSLIIFINMLISKKNYKMRNKLTPFECGFDNISKLRLPFSIQFFLISIIFLIFDVEISLIFPIVKMFKIMYFSYNNLFIYIMIILIIGLYYEWNNGSLKWL
uniref:NADH-ubiquinone oxidoreductase chain 3 n=1 Tax=Tessmannella kiplingi TaxID=2943473 RepID=A0A9E8K302_9HYME|nr:NADH dehydrogenase subunit 3 [Tessmannella kiplingi]